MTKKTIICADGHSRADKEHHCKEEAATIIQPLPVRRYGKKTAYCVKHAELAAAAYITVGVDFKATHIWPDEPGVAQKLRRQFLRD